jgi:hypothetical protein
MSLAYGSNGSKLGLSSMHIARNGKIVPGLGNPSVITKKPVKSCRGGGGGGGYRELKHQLALLCIVIHCVNKIIFVM